MTGLLTFGLFMLQAKRAREAAKGIVEEGARPEDIPGGSSVGQHEDSSEASKVYVGVLGSIPKQRKQITGEGKNRRRDITQ